MNEFDKRRCEPCEGGLVPLGEDQSLARLASLPGWELAADRKAIVRRISFKDFKSTMLFINAMAYMAEQQDHHPDFSAGYNYCEVNFSTHAIGGLSENDFICAAKINALLDA